MQIVDWLRDGDPAIRWQVLRDLTEAPPDQVAAERARVETDGWGARLLSLRDPDGHWDGGACFPRRIADDWRAGNEPDFSGGQPWTSTLPTLMLLHDLGLDPASTAPTQARPSSRSRTGTDARAGGTRCGRCASSTGTTDDSNLRPHRRGSCPRRRAMRTHRRAWPNSAASRSAPPKAG